jgi:hypothetical protein
MCRVFSTLVFLDAIQSAIEDGCGHPRKWYGYGNINAMFQKIPAVRKLKKRAWQIVLAILLVQVVTLVISLINLIYILKID